MLSIKTDDFTDKQKIIFLTTSVKALTNKLKKKNFDIGVMVSEIDELKHKIKESEKCLEKKNKRIKYLNKLLKIYKG